jgi:predicted nucleotidyltransferase
MRVIATIRYGSHLYGTAHPLSDHDIRAVFLPDPRDILLGRRDDVVREVGMPAKPPGAAAEYSGGLDHEAYSLRRYMELLSEGQTGALDLLFAPDWALTAAPTREWSMVRDRSDRLISRRSSNAFLGYCRQHSAKFSVKAERVAAARLALSVLQEAEAEHGTQARLAVIEPRLRGILDGENILLTDARNANGTTTPALEVCAKRMLFTQPIKTAREIVARKVDEYGKRVLAAEANAGFDGKGLSHAVRAAHEGIELMTTGRLTFPRPEAARLVEIKSGRVPNAEIYQEIEDLMTRLEAAVAASRLPDQPDVSATEEILLECYGKRVAGAALTGWRLPAEKTDRSPDVRPIVTIDVEASGGKPLSYPLEVGWSRVGIPGEGGLPATTSMLIRPAPDWLETRDMWQFHAEAVHGISYRQAFEHGHPVRQVAVRLNAELAASDVYSDDHVHDGKRLDRLFSEAGMLRMFAVRPLKDLHHRLNAHHVVPQARELAALRAPKPHRAGPDAAHLAAYTEALQELAGLARVQAPSHRHRPHTSIISYMKARGRIYPEAADMLLNAEALEKAAEMAGLWSNADLERYQRICADLAHLKNERAERWKANRQMEKEHPDDDAGKSHNPPGLG